MPHLTWGGGTETKLEFYLQRFANVSNPYEAIINSNIITSGSLQQPLVNLSYYARDNIASYLTVTKIPQENIEYLSSGLAASNCFNMFSGCSNLTSIPWNEFNIDTSQCTIMSDMFSDCDSITSLNLTGINTSKCTNMVRMFDGCRLLQKIICPDGFDLSSVTTNAMQSMFYDCNSYSGEPLHFKNVPRNLKLNSSHIYGIEGKHYVIDNYID